MSQDTKKKKTVKKSILFSILISVSITIILLYYTINDQTISYLKNGNIRYEFFIAAIFINIIYWVIWGARLKILSNAIDSNFNITLLESTKIVLANLFLANITPSMAGGEPVRIFLLNKKVYMLEEQLLQLLGNVYSMHYSSFSAFHLRFFSLVATSQMITSKSDFSLPLFYSFFLS